MKKYRWWFLGTGAVLLLFVSFPFVVIYLLNNGNPYTRYWTEKQVPAHLESQGYTKGDLLEDHWVLPNYRINNDIYTDGYMVRFKDEPTVTYTYGVKRHGKNVVQYCEIEATDIQDSFLISSGPTEHSESTCINHLENR
ncbi:DUF3139 domain-containing protein [Terribacillus saccharophilus]|uniref:DUF3139 domain-containing protein n=1 Tax=Terribacillus saccharophilus TaxID=361277 RepID=UPI00382B048B